MKTESQKISTNLSIPTHIFELEVRIQIGEGSLRNFHILAISTDFRSGVAESAGWAAEKVGKEVFGEFDGTEEKRPKQSSGQVVRR